MRLWLEHYTGSMTVLTGVMGWVAGRLEACAHHQHAWCFSFL